jgi:hypothetical protein
MGQIVYNVKVTLPEPLDVIGVKAHTENGGKSYSIELDLPENISKEALQSVAAEFVQKLIDRTKTLEEAKAAAAARSAKSAEAKREQLAAQIAQEERHARRQHFQQLAESRNVVKFDEAVMWATRNYGLALKLATEGTLQFLGPGADYSYVFSDPEHIGNDICPKCLQVSLKRSAPNSGGVVLVSCKTTGCDFHDYAHVDVEPQHRSVLHGRVTVGA